jgi:hypothetical protein
MFSRRCAIYVNHNRAVATEIIDRVAKRILVAYNLLATPIVLVSLLKTGRISRVP